MKIHYLIALLAMPAATAAQTWTYDDCVAYARLHNISLQKARLTEQTAAVDLEEAQAQWHPTLDFATSHTYANYPWTSGNKNSYQSTYGLNASWTVWNGGVRENTIRRNRLQTQIDSLATGQTMRTLETDLLQVYLNILYARESIGVCEEAAALSAAQAERGKALMQAGRLSRVDYARLDAQSRQDEYALVSARGTYDTRRMELKQLLELGIDADITPAPVDWDSAQVLAQLPPMDESYTMALAADLSLQGLDVARSAAAIDERIARAGRYPKIALTAGVGTGYYAPGASFGTAMKQGFGESVGLTLSIPILDGKKTRSAVARARVQQLDADLDIDKRRNDVAREIENWYIDTRASQARYAAAERALQAAELSRSLTDEQFALGYVNTVELMSAHNDYVEARHSLLQAKYMAMLGHKMIEYYRNASVNIP
ncbi:MAG: TolC family protein [Muribaculaceae bacterium]|nr:TolC family protein [Muribaculaceae bacterium]